MQRKDRILIVEDDQYYLAYIKELLLSKNLDVIDLTDGTTAFEKVVQSRPDLVILDLYMAGKDGLQLTEELKGHPSTFQTPIIILTGSVHHEDIVKCLEAGADDFINKNCKGYELFLRINAHLREKKYFDSLKQERDYLSTVLEVTKIAASSQNFKSILDAIVAKLATFFNLDRCSIIHIEPKRKYNAYVMASSDSANLFDFPVDLQKYPEIRRVYETKEILVIQDVEKSAIFDSIREYTKDIKWKSMMIVPLLSGGELFGVLSMRSSLINGFGESEVRLCQGIADAIANLLKNCKLYDDVLKNKEELEKAYERKYLELEQMNLTLHEAIQLKDDFLSICSHDIKSPVNVLVGHANLLIGERLGTINEDQQKSLKSICRQGKRIAKLVDDLLVLGKIEQKDMQPNLTNGSLNKFLIDCLQNMETVAAEKNITLKYHSNENLPVARTDFVLLKELVINLLHNAIKFTDTGKGIELNATVNDDRSIVISVKDEGIGIAPEDLPKIFDKFYTTKRPGIQRGSGLGLAIAKRITDLLDGFLTVESKPGDGSTFNAVFTHMIADDAPSPAREKEVQVSEDNKESTILIVDDDKETIELINMILKPYFKTLVAKDGLNALITARYMQPDLILMDVQMPQINGIEATRKLKMNEITRHIPVIMVSSHGDVNVKIQSFEAGAEDYISKPFDSDELLARIRVHLRRSKNKEMVDYAYENLP
jgi:DNA-binding response OmpR family regulator/signal transduction histidine kinase